MQGSGEHEAVAAAALAADGGGEPMAVDALPAGDEAGVAGAAAAAVGAAGPDSQGLADSMEGHPVYAAFEEKKEISERRAGRKSGGHTYVVKFFLVDTHGVEYLAATGEDQGDAHYLYENQSNFPFLRANNKGDVRLWLEGMIERSQERAGVHGHLVQDEVPADPNKIHLPKFVGHMSDKKELADGRHRIEWFLLDEANDAHLAIVGEEKDTRDGHYLYRTQGIFDKALPLQVGNQREVERWIDVMVFHGGVAPAGMACKAGDSQGGAPTLSGLSGHRASSRATGTQGGGRASQGGGQKKAAAGQKHDLLKQATSNVKKFKTAATGRLGVDPDQDARDAVAAELQKWAQEEAQRREAAKRQALAYATDPLAGKEAAAAKRCLTVLRQAAQQAGFLPSGAGTGRGGAGVSGTHQQQLNLVDTLGALRELAHMYAPLSLVSLPELNECLASMQAHQHPEVSHLASVVLEQWLRVAVAQAQVLTDPRYVEDPRSVLESKLSSREEMDPIVSAVTHRTLHPPASQQQQQQAPTQQQQQQQERGGSRLGPAPSAVAAAVAGLRDPGQQAAAATPGGGLSTRPSEQSLVDLLSTGGEPRLASMAPGGGGGTAGGKTVERRRLNLDTLDSPNVVLTSAGMRRQQQLSVSSSGEEEEEEEAAAAAAAAARGGTAADGDEDGDDNPSMSLGGDSQQQLARRSGGEGGSLRYAASVQLIDAPLVEGESEQAELLP